MNDLKERPQFAEMPADWFLQPQAEVSTDWTASLRELQEAEDFTQWERELNPAMPEANRDFLFKPQEMGATALADSVRITTQDESVRITASAVNRDF